MEAGSSEVEYGYEKKVFKEEESAFFFSLKTLDWHVLSSIEDWEP